MKKIAIHNELHYVITVLSNHGVTLSCSTNRHLLTYLHYITLELFTVA